MDLEQTMGRSRGGFTLLELMVVCVVIAVMTAMILPEMRGTFEEAKLKSSARGLVHVFQVARSRAITRREPQRVRFDVAEGRCHLERRARVDETGGGYVPAGIALGSGGRLDRRLDYRFGEVGAAEERGSGAEDLLGFGRNQVPGEVIFFYPDGTSSGGEVMIQDRQGYRLGLRVHPGTGRVELRELGRE